MKRALVLSGGGAKGAFEVGALEYIQQQRPSEFKFDVIAGVSVGALNGAMMAQKEFPRLQKLWDNLSDDRVYTGKVTLWRALFRILMGHKSILGIKPLIRQIEDNIDINKVSIDYRCGMVSLSGGNYISVRHTDFGSSNENFRKAILASATMPIIWEPVMNVTAGENSYAHIVDGGVRNVSPLKDVISEDPDEIIIINCSSELISPDEKAGKNIFTIAMRSLTDITINEIFVSDIEEFVKINSIVEQCKEFNVTVYRDVKEKKPYKYFNAVIIEPRDHLGDSLDFSQTEIQKRKKAGYEAAREAYSKYKPSAGVCTARSFK